MFRVPRNLSVLLRRAVPAPGGKVVSGFTKTRREKDALRGKAVPRRGRSRERQAANGKWMKDWE
jgi:hypothetical protein